MKSLYTTILVILFALTSTVQAQSQDFTLLEKSTMEIDGTSNIHDWTVDAQKINIDANFTFETLTAETAQNPVQSLTVSVPVKQLESGKGGMNRRMYDALKRDDFPNISFKLSSAELTDANADSTSFTLNASGTLTIAGVSKQVSFPVEGSMQEDGAYNFAGSYEIDMTEYNVEPPSAMFGAVKAGKMVTVRFDLFFN